MKKNTNMKDLKQKNKEGIANILLMMGICLIIGGIILGFINLEENVGKAFFMCAIGTILNFVSGYLRYGYVKFFN